MAQGGGHVSRLAIGALLGLVGIAAASSAVLIARGDNTHTTQTRQPQRLSASSQAAPPAQGGSSSGTTDQQGQGRVYLGVQIDESGGKVSVTQVVAGGPADKAGIKTGDVITAVDGASVGSFADLKNSLAAKKPGDTVTVSVDRGGAKQDIKVTLDALPQGNNGPRQTAANRGFLGVSVNNADDAAKQKYNLNTTAGALIVSVNGGGPAANAGLKEGDLINGVNGKTVANVNDLQTALQGTKSGDSANVQYQRAGSAQTATVTLGSGPAGFGSGAAGALPAIPRQPGSGRLPLGPGILGANFDRFISSETKTKDANGAVHTDTTVGGVVKSTANSQVVVTLNGGGDQTYSTDGNTRIVKGFGGKAQVSDLAQGDKVTVTTRDGSATATAIVDVSGLGGNVRSAFGNAGSGGFQISQGNGGLQIQIPGGQSITIPLPGNGNGGTSGANGPTY